MEQLTASAFTVPLSIPLSYEAGPTLPHSTWSHIWLFSVPLSVLGCMHNDVSLCNIKLLIVIQFVKWPPRQFMCTILL